MNWLNYLSSVKLTLILLILIVVVAIVGTIIPQESDNHIYVRLQLNDVYHSYWYMVLLILFCINLCLCSIKNIPAMIKSLKTSESKLTELNKLPFYKKIDLEAKDSGMLANSLIYSFTRKLFYKLKYSEPNNHFYYFERGRIGRFGPMITHASIIVIVIGGIIVSMTEFKGNIRLSEGGVVDVPNSNFKVQAEDFSVEFYPNSETPKDYVTKLSVIDKGETVVTKDVRVNHPLKYKGISFLQSDYGFVNTLGIKINKKVSETSEAQLLGEFKIDEGQTIDVSGTDLKVTLKSYIPDFVMDEEHNIHNRSSEPRNPAILLELADEKGLKEQMWLFLRFPGFQNSKQSDYMIEFISIYPPMKYYTGLQIRSNSGIEIVWIGSLMIICGLFLSFYTSHKRLWMRISSDSGKNVLEIGGRSYKNRSDFDRESNIIAKQLGVK
jgi:cytochrome c biogenesis protein